MSPAAEVQIQVSDVDAALRFYGDVLALQHLHDTDADGTSLQLGADVTLRLRPASASTPRPGTSGATRLALHVVPPLEDHVQRLEAKGVVFRGPIAPDGQRRVAHFGDPDGNDLCLIEGGDVDG